MRKIASDARIQGAGFKCCHDFLLGMVCVFLPFPAIWPALTSGALYFGIKFVRLGMNPVDARNWPLQRQ